MLERVSQKEDKSTIDAKLEVPKSKYAASSSTLYKQSISLAEGIEKSLIPIEDFPRTGIIFRDISPILENPKLFSGIIDQFADRYKNADVDAVVALEARGFLFGGALAKQLKVPLVMIRKESKLPGDVYRVSYKKLYGADTFVMRKKALKAGQKVVIVDDFYSRGGSLQAACDLVNAAGATVYEGAFLINNMDITTKLKFSFPIYSLYILKPGTVRAAENSGCEIRSKL